MGSVGTPWAFRPRACPPSWETDKHSDPGVRTQLPPDPYTVALRWLASRELSVAQVRQRLRQRGFGTDQIEAAIDRLQEARALDDRRTAGAYARTAVSLRLRGRARVLRDIEALGIDREDARAAIGEAFSEVDEATVLERALARRLHGPVQDLAHFRRLHQYLVRQGFPPGLAVAALKARSVF